MNNPIPFAYELQSAEDSLEKNRKLIYWIKCLINEQQYSAAYSAAFLLAEASEKFTLQTRLLPAYFGNPTAVRKIEDFLAGMEETTMGFTEQGWFYLRIPALLPKKSRGSAEYIRSLLYPAMRKFFTGKQPVRYPDSVLVFRHVYDRRRPERRYRDHDNVELNMVVDILSLYLLPDDAPLTCAHFYCSIKGDADFTEVFLIPKSEFIRWLTCHEKEKEMGLCLSGVPP